MDASDHVTDTRSRIKAGRSSPSSAENFNPSYVARGQHVLPNPATGRNEQHSHDYYIDKDRLPAIPVDDEALVYTAESNLETPT